MKEEENRIGDAEEAKPAWWSGPIRIILGLFLLLIILLWIVPSYSISLDPEPKNIPSLSEIQSNFINRVEIGNETGTSDIAEAEEKYIGINPAVKIAATYIATKSCTESKACHAKALYYFVRDSIQYVSDPYGSEYIASPVETLKTGGGDCDDGAVLLASLLNDVGINAQIVVLPGHAMVKAEIPEAQNKYKSSGWIYMDWTCSSCKFGEVSYNSVLQMSN